MKAKHAYSIFYQGKEVNTSMAKKLLIENQVLIAFHGFGQDAGVFKKVSTFYPAHVVFSFDLFCHGNSQVIPASYNVASFVEELQDFFKLFNIKQFSLMAFSIGARPALALAAHFPKKIVSVQLIAPDAIYENTWYILATRNVLGNWLFKQLKNNETLTIRFIEKLIAFTKGKNNLFKLAKKVLSNHSIGKVYHTWMMYSSFSFDSRSLINELLKKGISVRIVLSNKDHVIKEQKVKKVLKSLGNIFITVPYKHEKLLAKLIKSQYFNHALALG